MTLSEVKSAAQRLTSEELGELARFVRELAGRADPSCKAEIDQATSSGSWVVREDFEGNPIEGNRTTAIRLLEAYESLAPEDKQTFAREILLRLSPVDLRKRRIDEIQAGDLRARLKTFAEDWDRPEASIYDESPAR